MPSTRLVVRELTDADRPALRRLVLDSWGATRMVTRGRIVDVTEVAGLVAELELPRETWTAKGME